MHNLENVKNNKTEDRVLHLLGMGITPEIVAATCGISVSRISQLLSTPEFTAQVAELRFAALEKHNVIDNKYDVMEDKLLSRLEDCLPLISMDPLKLLRAISVINGAKRRGISAPEQIQAQNTVVQLIMPNVLVQKFTTNINNQVIHAGEQELTTIPSHILAQEFTNSGNNTSLKTISSSELISSMDNILSNTPPSNIPTKTSQEVQDAMQLLTSNG